MTNSALLPLTKKNRLQVLKLLPVNAVIAGGVCLLLGVLWLLIIWPLQQTLEQRLQRYPSQLMTIQELNRTLSTYKDNNVRSSSLSDSELSTLQQKLFSQGVKFTLARLENAASVQLDLKIDEIEFSRWLELMVDFRTNNGLYASDVVIKKNERVGVIQVTATLVQVR